MSAYSKVELPALRMMMTPELTSAHKTFEASEASELLESWDLECPANSAVSIPIIFSYFGMA